MTSLWVHSPCSADLNQTRRSQSCIKVNKRVHRRPARHPSLQKLTPCHSPTIKICLKERKQEHQKVETSLETRALSGTSIKSMARADKFKQISAIKIIRPPNGTRRANTTIIIAPSIAKQPRSLPTSSYRWLPAKAKRKT